MEILISGDCPNIFFCLYCCESVRLQSSLQEFYGRHRESLDRYDMVCLTDDPRSAHTVVISFIPLLRSWHLMHHYHETHHDCHTWSRNCFFSRTHQSSIFMGSVLLILNFLLLFTLIIVCFCFCFATFLFCYIDFSFFKSFLVSSVILFPKS